MRNIFFVVVLLLTAACTYSPDDDVLTELDRPKTPVDVYISLNDYDAATSIQLAESTEFTFSIGSDAGKLESVEVWFNNNLIEATPLPSGKFVINPTYFNNGSYTLRVQFKNRSGTGSLAETLGGERFHVWREWQINIWKGAPAKPLLTFSEESGHLKVSWEPYALSNFVSYTVTSKLPGGLTNVITITDPEKNFVINDGYVGSYVIEYSVAIKTKAYFTQGDVHQYSSPKVVLDVDFNPADSMVTLKWRKPKFEGAFTQYVVTENASEVRNVDVVSDTTATFKADVLFGKSLSYQVEIRAKNNFSAFTDLFEVKDIFKKLPLAPSNLHYNKTINSIISWSHQTSWGLLTVFDENFVEQSKTVCNWVGGHAVPFESPYVYYVEYQGKRIVQKNIQTNELQYVDINQDLGVTEAVLLVGVHTASANQLVTFNYYTDGGTKLISYTAIYDMANRSVVYHEQVPGENRYISPDGKYMMTIFKAYRIENGSLTYLYDMTGGFYFNESNVEEYIQFNNQTKVVKIFAINDGSLLRTYNYPVGCRRAAYDPGTNSVLLTGDALNQVYRMDVATGNVTSVIEAQMDNAFELDYIYGYMIDSENYYVKGWH